MRGSNRRRFLAAAALGTGLALHSRTASALAAEARGGGGSGRPDQGRYPHAGLALDLDAFEANLRTISEHCQIRAAPPRPHAKTHKCPEIARRQVAAGCRGVAVATVPEAEAMVAAGIQGVLLTSPIVEPGKIATMVKLAKTDRRALDRGRPSPRGRAAGRGRRRRAGPGERPARP